MKDEFGTVYVVDGLQKLVGLSYVEIPCAVTRFITP